MGMESEVAVQSEQRPLSANAVVARVRLVQEVMKAVMKKDTHWGTIPGCQKPSLYKPGAEVLLVTFRIAPDEPTVDDLSNPDCVRYRVVRKGLANGSIVAAGVGECSSDEEKYKWRAPVCDGEFDATAEDRRRLKWKRDGTSYKQVRTNPADVANTILKMADKRAFIAMTLLATAASDIFTQDLEDLPPEIAEGLEGGEAQPAKAPIKEPTPKAVPAGALTFVPAGVDVRSGGGEDDPKNKEKEPSEKGYVKVWTKYGIRHPDGTAYGTFDENFGNAAMEAADAKKPVTLTFKDDGKYKAVVTLTA